MDIDFGLNKISYIKCSRPFLPQKNACLQLRSSGEFAKQTLEKTQLSHLRHVTGHFLCE